MVNQDPNNNDWNDCWSKFLSNRHDRSQAERKEERELREDIRLRLYDDFNTEQNVFLGDLLLLLLADLTTTARGHKSSSLWQWRISAAGRPFEERAAAAAASENYESDSNLLILK